MTRRINRADAPTSRSEPARATKAGSTEAPRSAKKRTGPETSRNNGAATAAKNSQSAATALVPSGTQKLAPAASDSLGESEIKLCAIFDNSPDAIGVTVHGVHAFVNPAYVRLFGFERAEQVTGTRILDLIAPEARAVAAGYIEQRARGGAASASYQTRGRRCDGTCFDMEVTISEYTLDGKVHTLAFLRDVTERVQAAAERRALESQMQRLKRLESLSVLAGGIAHDFNNLLVAMLCHADLVLRELPADSPLRDDLTQIERAARRAAELTRQMLAYSGRGRFIVQPLDLRELVKDMKAPLELSISKKAMLRCDVASPAPSVVADATQIRQMLSNLVANASEAIGDAPGTITISLSTMACDRAYLANTYVDEDLPEGCYLLLEVSDTGCGMDAATLGRVFDPFFSTKFTGRGLGLAAVLGIVRGHRGAIHVYSEPGHGTTFKILLPATPLATAVAGAARTAASEWRGQGTVLLVDDEEEVRIVAKRMLERFGLTVLTASDGHEALDVFRARPGDVDLVILDLTMPRLDGEETFRELRRIAPDISVLLSTGYNEQTVAARFTGQGLAGFLQKPYTRTELARQLAALLDRPPSRPS